MGATDVGLPTVVILSALPVEYDAVRRHMKGVREVELPQGTLLEVGGVVGVDWRVALVETGPTNTRAALIAQHVIEHYAPQALCFVGVAGSLKDDVRIGDVVAATRIYGYHGGREGRDGFSARPTAWEPSHRVDQLLRSARRNEPWAFLRPEERETTAPPEVHLAPIAAGDVVVDSRDSTTARRIRRHYNDAVAVEMESHGVTQAVRMRNDVETLVVRGISDGADGNKSRADAEGSQQLASRNAAAFALRVLRDLRVPSGTRSVHASERHPLSVAVVRPRLEPGPQRVDGHKPAPAEESWAHHPVVTVGERSYLVYEGPEDLLTEDHDAGVIRRQARARSLPDRDRTGAFVWLRQVRALPGTGAGSETEAHRSLRREAELCHRFGGPKVVQLLGREDTVTLALRWPVDTRHGGPRDTLREYCPTSPVGAERPNSVRLLRALRGLIPVTETLDRLHEAGIAHRALRPTAIVLGDPGMSLRDLGLAATRPRPGEHPGPYQAPEQRHGALSGPGPATDVYQLGAILHQLLAGRPPVEGLPPYRSSGPVPPGLAQLLAATLARDPAARPPLRMLRAGLHGAARELARAPHLP
ncbi:MULTISPECIES: phosphorylase family protein [Streptomyces]|uniref:phosphorylase family protein n=1 Tax=Streptomyces TaxID=1883 RepID=UPI00186B44A5|nr:MULTISPECIES: hypothetical protein [Streptomyces]